MNKYTIPIKGMHCRSCELLIEEKLKEIPEIKNVQVSYKKKNAIIYSKHELNQKIIQQTVKEAGYKIGTDDAKAWISKDPIVYTDLLTTGIVLFIVYFLAREFGLFSINVGSFSNPGSLFVVLLIGLTAGISTCMALVGGLVLGISAKHAEKHPEATSAQKFRPHLFFNLGRISSYFLLGGIIGLIGKAFQLSGPTLGIMTIIVGSVMLLVGLQLTELFPVLSNFKLTLPSSISKVFGIKKRHEKEYGHTNSILTGALTFFLPCGFTQAMQLYAMSTGSFWKGALIMGVFALGTAPGLLSIGGLTSVLKGMFARRFFKFAGILVIVLSIVNISNGARLTGINFNFSSTENNRSVEVNDPNVTLENGVQVVRMDQVGAGYKPNSFTIKKGIPVKWIITSKSQSCAASIYSAKLGIRQNLDPGKNIIEFTPKETGKIPFSCSMGMYTGSFTVIENNSSTTSQTQTNLNTNTEDSNKNTNSPVSSSEPKKQADSKDVQLLKTTYISANKDIQPNEFTIKAGLPARLEIDVQTQGYGCMSSITLPGLSNQIYNLKKGEKIVFEFTPKSKGSYDITCAMGVPRGTITVI